jgi:hypothetical protein
MNYQWRKTRGFRMSDSLAESKHATEVRALSLNRLLKETVTRADYVVLKVDVEASEYELLGVAWRAHPHYNSSFG